MVIIKAWIFIIIIKFNYTNGVLKYYWRTYIHKSSSPSRLAILLWNEGIQIVVTLYPDQAI